MIDDSINKLLDSVPREYLEFANRLLESGNSTYNVQCLFSYDFEIINAVKSYYNVGYDIVPLIEVEDSDWYVKFLLDCVVNRLDIMCLVDRDLSVGNIYNLACCMALGYDIKRILVSDDLRNLTRKEILSKCLSQEKGLENSYCRLYLVKGGSVDDEFKSHCILAPSTKYAKLLASVSGCMNVFDCIVESIDTSIPSIIHTSDF